MRISFFSESIKFNLKNKGTIREWLSTVATKEKSSIAELNYIFCSDEYLLQLNIKHLNHNTLTDIITFDNTSPTLLKTQNSKPKTSVSGDIFISVDRVKENAAKFNVVFEHELSRVIVHGLLHLLGYKDKKPKDKALMTTKEDHYLKML